MSFEIKRPGDTTGDGARLSALGKRVVIALVILAVVVSILVFSRVQANRRLKELADDVLAAIDRAELVCTNALSAVGAGDQAVATLRDLAGRIAGAKQLEDKVALAQEMITYALAQAGGSQAQVDELNGARNRILLAMQEYAKQQ